MPSNRYVVLNCPTLMGNRVCYSKVIKQCADCTDCVIKQVVEKCKKRSGKCERCKANEDYQPTDCLDYCSYDDVIFAEQILQIFNIEEINK